MRTLFLKTESMLEDCRNHIDEAGLHGSPIESYLTKHIVVVLCAEMQQEINKSIEQFASTINHPPVSIFIKAACNKIFRSVKKNEIAGLLENFGPEIKEKFNTSIDESKISYYSNAVLARHSVAHSTGSNITFEELIQALEAAKLIIRAVDDAFSWVPALANSLALRK